MLPTVVVSHLPVQVRRAGEWRYSHEVKLATGWTLLARSIDPEVETTRCSRFPWRRRRPGRLHRERLGGRRATRSADSQVASAGVRGRPAKIVTRPGDTVNVYWEYAPGAWASVDCDAQVPLRREAMVGIAEAVRFHDVRQLLPYTLTGPPEGYRIRTVGETFAPLFGTWSGDPPCCSNPRPTATGPRSSSVPTWPYLPGVSAETTVSCLDPDRSLCVSAFQMDDQVAPDRGMSRRTVAATIAELRPASSPTDRSTWFDATTLPG